MEKPARTQFPIHELIARRWSPRAFDERPIEARAAARTCITAPESPADQRIDICRAMGTSHRITGG